MRKLKKNGGFTVIELMVTVCLIVVVFGGIFYGVCYCVIAKGNVYFTEDTLLRAAKRDNSAIVRVVDYDRNLLAYSTMVVEDNEGNQFNYDIDANLLFDAKAYLQE